MFYAFRKYDLWVFADQFALTYFWHTHFLQKILAFISEKIQKQTTVYARSNVLELRTYKIGQTQIISKVLVNIAQNL